MCKNPTYSDNKMKGNLAANTLKAVISRFACVNTIDESVDLGIDMRAELFKHNAPTGLFFNIQCKGKDKIDELTLESGVIKVAIKVATVNYWKMQNDVTLLFIVDISTGNCYWCNPLTQIDTIFDKVQNQDTITIRIKTGQCINFSTLACPSDILEEIQLFSFRQLEKLKESVRHHHVDVNVLKEFRLQDFRIYYYEAENDKCEHYFAHILIESNNNKRLLSDYFGTLIHQTDEGNIDLFKTFYDHCEEKDIICMVSEKAQIEQSTNGTLSISFTMRNHSTSSSWYFYLVFDQYLNITDASSIFCYEYISNMIDEENHLESRYFVREDGPDAWGALINIPPKSWWSIRYTVNINAIEEWRYVENGTSFWACCSGDIIEIFNKKNDLWMRDTIVTYSVSDE